MPPSIEIVIYTAGLFDGEGCIQFRTAPDRRFVISISQCEANDGKAVLERLRDDWGGIGSICLFGKIGPRRKSNHYCWQICNAAGAHEFLSAIEPHLRIKREKAQACLAATTAFLQDHRSCWTKGMDAEITQHWRTSTLAQLSERVGRTVDAVRHRGKKLKLPKRPPGGWR